MMRKAVLLHLICVLLGVFLVNGEDPYKYYTWTVTYGTISPLGVPQQVGNVAIFVVFLNVRKFSCFSEGLMLDL